MVLLVTFFLDLSIGDLPVINVLMSVLQHIVSDLDLIVLCDYSFYHC